MLVRSAFFACAALIASVAPALADEPARCDATSFRVYFSENSATLDSAARDMMAAAERQVADCNYAELRMTLDASSPLANQRVAAIRAAADDQAWDVVRVEARPMMQRASYGGPDYAMITMTPEVGTNRTMSPPNVGL